MPEENEPLYNLTKTPSVDKKPTIFNIILVIILLIVAIALLFGVSQIVNKPGLKNTSTKTSTSEATPNNQVTQGAMLGVWGTVTKISDYKAGTTNEATSAGGVATTMLTLTADSTKVFQVLVNKSTLINKYQGATQKDPPKLLSNKAVYTDLAVGARVYLSTKVDLQKITSISVDKIVTLDWYLPPPLPTTVPK